MRILSLLTLLLAGLVIPTAFAEEWEAGGAVGFSYLPGNTITNGAVTGKAGLQPMASGSFYVTNREKKRLSGDFWYTYRLGDLKLTSGSTKVTFDSQSHLVHYDLVLHPKTDQKGLDPYFAFGGGVRVLRGIGRETANQGLNQLAVLSKTRQVLALASFAAGVRKPIGKNLSLRLEARDNISPFPDKVIFLNSKSNKSGWWHDLTAQVALGIRF